MFYVKATYRDNPCDSSSPIAGLVLDSKYNEFTVHSVQNLEQLANNKQLAVYSEGCGKNVYVNIYFHRTYQRWVATTTADGLECNNLLSLPIYYPASKQGTTTTYNQCSL